MKNNLVKYKTKALKELEQIYDMVISSISGNGNYRVNGLIKTKKERLKQIGYGYSEFGDIINSISIKLLYPHEDGTREIDKWNPEKSSLQNYVNWVVLSYLNKQIRNALTRRKVELICPEPRNYSLQETLNPEELMIIKQFVDKVRDIPDWEIYLDVFMGEITKAEATKEIGITKQLLNYRYTKFYERINDIIEK